MASITSNGPSPLATAKQPTPPKVVANTPKASTPTKGAKQATATTTPPKPVRYASLAGVGATHNVTLLVANPKRGASAARYNAYGKVGTTQTVAACLLAGVWRADLSWDLARGYIAITGPVATKAPKARKAKQAS